MELLRCGLGASLTCWLCVWNRAIEPRVKWPTGGCGAEAYSSKHDVCLFRRCTSGMHSGCLCSAFERLIIKWAFGKRRVVIWTDVMFTKRTRTHRDRTGDTHFNVQHAIPWQGQVQKMTWHVRRIRQTFNWAEKCIYSFWKKRDHSSCKFEKLGPAYLASWSARTFCGCPSVARIVE